MIRAALLSLALAFAAPVLAAGDPAADIAAATDRVAAAGQGLDAASAAAAGDEITALAEAITTYQAALNGLGRAVAAAGAREDALTVDLTSRRDENMRLIAALEAMARAPSPETGLHPQGPLAAARAAATMQRLGPALAAEAATLRQRTAELDAARSLRARGDEALATGLARLAGAQVTLSELLAAAPLPLPATDAPELAALARDSLNLTQLAAALAGPAGSADAAGPGPLLWPVTGEIVGHFNEADAAGVKRPGLLVAAAPLALVRAPADAVVRYAGPFLEYGYVVVLEPAPGTMIVLAGMAQLQAQTGTALKRGALVGLLGGRPPSAAANVEESVMDGGEAGAGPVETLYIELRSGRGPVDPEPLLAGENG